MAYEFESLRPHHRYHAVVAQLVERHLAKVEVASPSLVYRSIRVVVGRLFFVALFRYL